MIFFCDEGVDREIVARLRFDGFETHHIAETLPGAPDEVVLQQANALGALLVTMDKDFGELVFRLRMVTTGILLVRLHGFTPQERSEIVSTTVAAHVDELRGAFSVLSPTKLRIRPRLLQ